MGKTTGLPYFLFKSKPVVVIFHPDVKAIVVLMSQTLYLRH